MSKEGHCQDERRRAQSARTLADIYQHMEKGTRVRINAAEHAGKFNACRAALLASTVAYPADAAPPVPLRDCEHPDRCICTYSVDLGD